jgi:hypothetical protein
MIERLILQRLKSYFVLPCYSPAVFSFTVALTSKLSCAGRRGDVRAWEGAHGAARVNCGALLGSARDASLIAIGGEGGREHGTTAVGNHDRETLEVTGKLS